jgi:hypothetical protein
LYNAAVVFFSLLLSPPNVSIPLIKLDKSIAKLVEADVKIDLLDDTVSFVVLLLFVLVVGLYNVI